MTIERTVKSVTITYDVSISDKRKEYLVDEIEKNIEMMQSETTSFSIDESGKMLNIRSEDISELIQVYNAIMVFSYKRKIGAEVLFTIATVIDTGNVESDKMLGKYIRLPMEQIAYSGLQLRFFYEIEKNYLCIVDMRVSGSDKIILSVSDTISDVNDIYEKMEKMTLTIYKVLNF